MTPEHHDKRTSAQQLMWVWNKIIGFFKGLFSHIRRCRGVYSFLSGALSTLFFLWAFVWYGVLAYPVPWKVTEPTDPRFDPLAFRFSDYSPSYLPEVQPCLFPAGTPKSYVDHILVEIGGASVKKDAFLPSYERSHPNMYTYTYSRFRDRLRHAYFSMLSDKHSIEVRYDSANKVEPYNTTQCPEAPPRVDWYARLMRLIYWGDPVGYVTWEHKHSNR